MTRKDISQYRLREAAGENMIIRKSIAAEIAPLEKTTISTRVCEIDARQQGMGRMVPNGPVTTRSHHVRTMPGGDHDRVQVFFLQDVAQFRWPSLQVSSR
jgi:hypothetical protein